MKYWYKVEHVGKFCVGEKSPYNLVSIIQFDIPVEELAKKMMMPISSVIKRQIHKESPKLSPMWVRSYELLKTTEQ